MVIQNDMNMYEKLTILSDAAKYDVACTSSGVAKKNNGKGIGNSTAAGICHSFGADGRCISLLKILFTNECIFDCKYCCNRASNDVVRTTFTPEEVCTLTMEFYRRNYIEGLFLSSGIIKSPDNTMRLLLETVMLLRNKYNFGGYIHLKGIPGASTELVELAGWYTDRMSINLELPTADGLKSLAPHKTRKNILTPMRHIQNGISNSKIMLSDYSRLSSATALSPQSDDYTLNGKAHSLIQSSHSPDTLGSDFIMPASKSSISMPSGTQLAKQSPSRFVPAGQSTQMIIGATPESDYQLVTVAEALYKNYDLKRVFYSAFINVNQDSSLPIQENGEGVPLLREHRLYQADWLMRFYGFKSNELLSESKPNFNIFLDPKCDWAIRHLEHFPIEVNRADYYTLLRVPGIGVNSAKRIVKARRSSKLDFSDLKKIGVVLKRALYFITCSGKMMYNTRIDADYITNCIVSDDRRKNYAIEHHDSYRQLSLFDDFNFGGISS